MRFRSWVFYFRVRGSTAGICVAGMTESFKGFLEIQFGRTDGEEMVEEEKTCKVQHPNIASEDAHFWVA